MRQLAGILWALPMITLAVGCTVAANTTPTAAPPAPTEPTATLPPTPDAGPWQVILEARAESGMRAAAFMDDKIGFTGGATNTGKVHYTSDGGQTWQMVDSGQG